jgi:hypothetical protein
MIVVFILLFVIFWNVSDGAFIEADRNGKFDAVDLNNCDVARAINRTPSAASQCDI